MNRRILLKLESAWSACPDANLGALLEAVEEKAWDTLHQRHCSMRLMNMPDDLFEKGLDVWMRERGVATTGGWKS